MITFETSPDGAISFFWGTDFPECARVLNLSINLAVQGGHETPIPPIETYLELLEDGPLLKLTSIDLRQTVTLTKIIVHSNSINGTLASYHRIGNFVRVILKQRLLTNQLSQFCQQYRGK
jgi:hypothetical protein